MNFKLPKKSKYIFVSVILCTHLNIYSQPGYNPQILYFHFYDSRGMEIDSSIIQQDYEMYFFNPNDCESFGKLQQIQSKKGSNLCLNGVLSPCDHPFLEITHTISADTMRIFYTNNNYFRMEDTYHIPFKKGNYFVNKNTSLKDWKKMKKITIIEVNRKEFCITVKNKLEKMYQ